MKQIITAETFEKSIRTSLSLVFNYDAACHRVTGWLNNMPMEKMYIRKDRKQIAFYEKKSGKQIYLSKKSDRIYILARKKYLEILQEILNIIRLHRSSSSGANEFNYYSDIELLTENLVTFEDDIATDECISEIIQEKILPRLWF